MDTLKIGEFLKALRKAKGYTQEEVANRLMLSPKTISRWESGNGIPDINIISAVADLYSVTVDEILKGERQTEKQSQLSEQTNKLKNDSKVKVIMNNIINKYNHYFISSLSIIGATLLLAIIFGFLGFVTVAYFLMFLGLTVGIVIMIIANSDVKGILTDSREEGLEEGINKTEREIRRRNVLFLDLFVATTLIELFIFYILLASSLIYLDGNYILLVGFIFEIVLLVCYLIFRKYYANYELKGNLRELNDCLFLIASVLSIFSILFYMNVSITVSDINNVKSTSSFETWIFTYFYNTDVGYLYRGISIGLLALSIGGLLMAIKYKKASLILLSTVMGIISSILSISDAEYRDSSVSAFSILSLIILFIIIIFIFKNKKAIKNNRQV